MIIFCMAAYSLNLPLKTYADIKSYCLCKAAEIKLSVSKFEVRGLCRDYGIAQRKPKLTKKSLSRISLFAEVFYHLIQHCLADNCQ